MTYYRNGTKRKTYSAKKIANLVTLIILLLFVLFIILYLILNIPTAMDYDDYEGGIRAEVNSGVVTFRATAPAEHCSYSGGLIHNADSDYYDMENGIEYRSWYIEGQASLMGKLFGVEEGVRVSMFSLGDDGDSLRYGKTELYGEPKDAGKYLELRINRVYYKNSDGSFVLLWSLDGDASGK